MNKRATGGIPRVVPYLEEDYVFTLGQMKCIKKKESLSFPALIKIGLKVFYLYLLAFNYLILPFKRFYHVLTKVEGAAKRKAENENCDNGCFHVYPLLRSILSLHIEKVKIILTCLILSAGMILLMWVYGWLIDHAGMFGRM